MVQGRRILILMLLASILACSKATPEFDLLDSDAIPQPKFSGQTVKNVSVTSTLATIPVNGECDYKIKSIVAAPVGLALPFSTLGDFTASAPVVNCSSGGVFSLELKSLAGLGYFSFYEGKVFEVQLKGMTSSGLSKASVIRITYSTGVGNRDVWIAAGGINGGGDAAFKASNASFKAEVFLSYAAKKDPALFPANANFSLRTGGLAR